MTQEQINELITSLTGKGVTFEVGLTETEIAQIETRFNVKFPPDLSKFLATALPVSKGFMDWRKGLTSKEIATLIRDKIEWPFEGMVYDIENNDFWVDNWGAKPASAEDRKRIARQHFDTYPPLIPICSHRYIPSRPFSEWNPIFSVYQMDIIYYGFDLPTYFANEFDFTLTGKFEMPEKPRLKIEFWSEWTGE